MPPKAKSDTTSSVSVTNKAGTRTPRSTPGPTSKSPPGTGVQTDVQFVKGVGPRLGAIFSSRGIKTVRDLLFFFPRAYEDRSRLLKIPELKEGEPATMSLTVQSSRMIPTRTGRTFFDVRATDGTGTMNLKWFYLPKGMDKRFTPGTQFLATGTVKLYQGRPEIVHPEITWGSQASTSYTAAPGLPTEGKEQAHVGRVVPVYSELEGIPSRTFRNVLWEAVEKYCRDLPEDLPSRFLERHQLPAISQSVREIHFPPPERTSGSKETAAQEIAALLEFATPAHARLIYDEFLKFEFLVLKQRLQMEKKKAPRIGQQGGTKAVEDLRSRLPFELTGDQLNSVNEILADLAQPHPMNRLIQGDVGSGKTAVALLAAGAVLAEGGQATLMAPTEILAEQHHLGAQRLFGGRLNTALLTGKTTITERRKILERLSSGEPLLLIGTHALIETEVKFAALRLILIDEQQRFGVEQRRTLREKGVYSGLSGTLEYPHSLVLSATPIPRTLALTAYGDLSVSIIKQMPKGRQPIITKVIRGEARAHAYERIREEIRDGHQAYFIFPLVNESEAEGFTHLKSATEEAQHLQAEVFKEFKVALLHGQMKADEKAAVMEAFKRNEYQILVSTTVVEVGVDVPNATVMVIEHSERFGLSQLHQLRGRVGRGSAQSYCFLFTHGKPGQNTEARLEVLERTTDGFQIAEADLEIRGPGDFLGTQQAGALPFKMADLVRDRDWLLKARDDAQELLRQDPDLLRPENQAFRLYLEREGSLQAERLKTS